MRIKNTCLDRWDQINSDKNEKDQFEEGQLTMYEIIADAEDYGIDILEEGMGNNRVVFPEEERKKWAEEIGAFASNLNGLAERAAGLQNLLAGKEKIVATPASLKTLKVMLFKVNDAMNAALNLAGQIETQIVKK
jgi:hypothetical protein